LTGGDPLSLVLTYCIEWQKEEKGRRNNDKKSKAVADTEKTK
jgi:hypothetical protein